MIRTGSIAGRKAGEPASAFPQESRRRRDARRLMKTGAVFAYHKKKFSKPSLNLSLNIPWTEK